jgi:hypothetical protein
MFKILSTYICWKNIYKMQHLEGSGTPVLYIKPRFLKVKTLPRALFRRVRKSSKATISFVTCICPSVRMEQLGSHWTEFNKIWYLSIFQKLVEKIQISFKSDNNNGALHGKQYTFLIISRLLFLRMRKVSEKIWREIKIHILYSIFFFFENFAGYEIKRKNTAEPDRPQMTIWLMRIAWCIHKSTNRHSLRNTYCFSTAIMVTRTGLNVTLYAHYLSLIP